MSCLEKYLDDMLRGYVERRGQWKRMDVYSSAVYIVCIYQAQVYIQSLRCVSRFYDPVLLEVVNFQETMNRFEGRFLQLSLLHIFGSVDSGSVTIVSAMLVFKKNTTDEVCLVNSLTQNEVRNDLQNI